MPKFYRHHLWMFPKGGDGRANTISPFIFFSVSAARGRRADGASLKLSGGGWFCLSHMLPPPLSFLPSLPLPAAAVTASIICTAANRNTFSKQAKIGIWKF